MRNRQKQPIGLICSVAAEGETLSKKLRPVASSGPLKIFSGDISGSSVVLVFSGMGKVNAAHAATILIREFGPSFVLNFGICGAYPSSGLSVGDIALATEEIYADEGVFAGDGFHTLEAIGIPLLKKGGKNYFNRFPADTKLRRKAEGAIGEMLLDDGNRYDCAGIFCDVSAKSGPFATVSTCTGTLSAARKIEKRFGVICENMEGAAVAQVCALLGVRFVEIRGVSNIVEDRDLSRWDIKAAARRCGQAVGRFCAKINAL